MEFKVKTGPQGHLYIPKRIREILGKELKILPDARAILVFSASTSYEDILQSVAIIASHIKQRITMQENPPQGEP